jgi:hypothetical protein
MSRNGQGDTTLSRRLRRSARLCGDGAWREGDRAEWLEDLHVLGAVIRLELAERIRRLQPRSMLGGAGLPHLHSHICAETLSFSHNLSRDSLILPHLHRDSLILPHLSRSPLPHLRRDCAHPAHICARTAPGAACCSCRDCAHNSACAKPTRLGQPAVAGQHATRSTQHATRNIRHATCNTQRTTCNSRHARSEGLRPTLRVHDGFGLL